MYYDEYMQKINKFVKIRDIIYKYRYLILAVLVVVFSTSFTLMSLKGSFSGNLSIGSHYEYGDEYQPKIKAFLTKKITYEYFSNGQWITEKPIMPGDYAVRAVAKNGFGKYKYSNQEKFSIGNRQLNVIIADSVVYGDMLNLRLDGVIQGDRLATEQLQIDYSNILTVPKVKIQESSFKIFNADGIDVTKAYNFDRGIFNTKPITILKRNLVINTASAQKVYDGTPITSGGYECLTKLAFKDVLSVKITGSQTNAGEVNNTAECVVKNEDNLNVTSLYDITINCGILKVEKRDIGIRTLSASKIYDGRELSAGYEVSNNNLLKGHRVEVLSQAKIIHVNKVLNEFDFRVIASDGSDVTENYNINLQMGELEILKRPLYVTVYDNEKIYDATEYNLLAHGYTLNKKYPLVSGEEFNGNLAFTASGNPYIGIHVGEYEIDFSNLLITSSIYGNVTFNYDIKVTKGSLTVQKRPIGVKYKTATIEKIYDATNQIDFDLYKYVVIDPNYSLAENEIIGKSVICKCDNDAGFYKNGVEFTLKIFNNEVDVSHNYEILGGNSCNFDLKINKRPIKIALYELVSRPYTGETLVSNEWSSVLSDYYLEVVKWHEVKVKTSSKITEPGKCENLISSITILDGKKDVTSNYSITKQNGYLEVTKRKVTIKPLSFSKIYDGTEIEYPTDLSLVNIIWTNQEDSKYGNALLSNHTVKCSIDYQPITKVGKSSIWIDGEDELEILQNAVNVRNKYYDVTIEKNTIEVLPRPIVVKSLTKERVFDGGALNGSVDDCYIAVGTLVNGDTIEYGVSSSINSIGSVINQITKVVIRSKSGEELGRVEFDRYGKVIKENGLKDCYHIEVICGKLILTSSNEKTFG